MTGLTVESRRNRIATHNPAAVGRILHQPPYLL
jgi:hypothetical protein